MGRHRNRYYSLVTEDGSQSADLYIFGDIVDSWCTGLREAWNEDMGEASGMSIAKDLASLSSDVTSLTVHINSLGGYTFEGICIYNLLRSCPQTITTVVDGIAASAASIIYMAGETRIVRPASMLMIHNAWSSASGNAEQLRTQADTLEKISASAAEAYMTGVKISREELGELLDANDHEGSYLTAQEALDMGFATQMDDEDPEEDDPQSSALHQIGRAMRGLEARSSMRSLSLIKDEMVKDIVSALKKDPASDGQKDETPANPFLRLR